MIDHHSRLETAHHLRDGVVLLDPSGKIGVRKDVTMIAGWTGMIESGMVIDSERIPCQSIDLSHASQMMAQPVHPHHTSLLHLLSHRLLRGYHSSTRPRMMWQTGVFP